MGTRLHRQCAAIPLVLALGGCTVVNVTGPVRSTRVEFGVLKLEPVGNASVLVYQARGIGLVPGRDGVTLGLRDDTVAAIYSASDCRLILFKPDAAALRVVDELAAKAGKPLPTICPVGENDNAILGK